MNIFVLSLRTSNARRQRVGGALDQLGIHYQFVDALSPDDLSEEDWLKVNALKTRRLKGYTLTDPEIACYFSHIKLWKWCVETGQNALILEDNIALTETFLAGLDQLPSLDGCLFPPLFIKIAATRSQKSFMTYCDLDNGLRLGRYPQRTAGTCGYMMMPDAAKLLLQRSDEILFPVDDYMEKGWMHGVAHLNLYPDLVVRDRVPSTIGGKRKLKMNLAWHHKIIIEAFRIYDQVMLRLFKCRIIKRKMPNI